MSGERDVKESPKRLRFVAWLVAVMAIFVAFGVGVVVGKPAPVRKPHVSKKRPRSFEERVAENDLATCRKRLSTRTQAVAAASAAAASAEKVKREQPEVMARIEALEGQVEECDKRDLLVRAEVCSSYNRYSIMMFALLEGAESCVDTVGLGDFIRKNHNECPGLDGVLEDWDPDNFTEAERKRIVSAAYEHRRFKKENAEGMGRYVIGKCIERYGPHSE